MKTEVLIYLDTSNWSENDPKWDLGLHTGMKYYPKDDKDMFEIVEGINKLGHKTEIRYLGEN